VSAIAVVLLVALSEGALHIAGTVLDPQELAVAAADVELICDGRTVQSTSTTQEGAFTFVEASSQKACRVSVKRPGFEPYVGAVRDNDAKLVIRLRLARVTEAVRVSAPVPVPSIHAPIGSLVLGSDELLRISDRTEDVIRAATLSAAGGSVPTVVYVDGLPVTVLPPVEMIARLGVNTNPFSAEFGDGDVNSVQIVTKGLARRFRVAPGGSLLGFGGGSGLRPGMRSQSHGASLAISGPVPRLPVTLSGTIRGHRSQDQVPVEAVIPSAASGSPGTDSHAWSADSARELWSLGLSGHYSASPGVNAHAAYAGTRSDSSNVGVGGLVLPAAGVSSRTSTDNLQASLRAARGPLLQEGGLVVRSASSTLQANTAGPGISVAGYFVDGGAPMSQQDSRRFGWSAKYVVRSASGRPWTGGLVVSRTQQAQAFVPNAFGTLEFDSGDSYARALDGSATGMWSVARGNTPVDYTGVDLAPFIQKTFVHIPRMQLDAGVRADVQSMVGTMLSPRLWMATSWRGFSVQGGAGLFVERVPDGVFVRATMNDGSHVQQYIANAVAIRDLTATIRPQSAIRTVLASDLAAARQLMQRVAVERSFRSFIPSFEYTWALDRRRLGSDRLASQGEWTDTIESNRSATRHRLHSRLRYDWRGQSFVGRYEWVHAADNGDGAFSYPERQGQFAAEWAPSGAFAPHNVSVAGTLSLPANIHATATATWQSSVPFNIVSGYDDDRNGLFTERDGRPRNSGRLPEQQVVSLHASRRFAVSGLLGRPKVRMFLTTGVQVENLLNTRNVTALGAVAGSSIFGRPLAALGGRSVRFWFNLS